jgi:8-amino-7-oxononanoate synthase
MANLGVITTLVGRGDLVLEDRLNHASLLDAALLSRARLKRFQHLDLADLTAQIADHSAECLIATDGVFSMDGDEADINGLSQIARQNNAWLMVDDAHGFGVLGEQGQGSRHHQNVDTEQLPIYMATLGKAAGVFGAFVAGSDELIESLIQYARSYIYTTAMPPALAEAMRASLQLIQTESWRRERLQQHIARLRQGINECGLNLMPSQTAIQPLLIGDTARALALSAALKEQGIWVSAIRPPTVPEGTARLRITLSATHTDAHIEQLINALHTVAEIQ